MIWLKNQTYTGAQNRASLYDVCYHPQGKSNRLPVIFFAHGYKGYKDWGAWHLVAEAFAKAGFIFVKFNFSHNGGTVENPIDFPDLEAFGDNRYSYELFDYKAVFKEIFNLKLKDCLVDANTISCIGHSRGGGATLVFAAQEKRVKNIICWASVSDFGNRFPKDIENWKKEGVVYVENGRTKQQMPHYFSFYTDYKENKQLIDIPQLSKNIKQPTLIINGTNDAAVTFDEAEQLHQWIEQSELILLDKANHTFGSKHPWEESTLPNDLQNVVNHSIAFIKNNYSVSD